MIEIYWVSYLFISPYFSLYFPKLRIFAFNIDIKYKLYKYYLRILSSHNSYYERVHGAIHYRKNLVQKVQEWRLRSWLRWYCDNIEVSIPLHPYYWFFNDTCYTIDGLETSGIVSSKIFDSLAVSFLVRALWN